VLSAVIDNTVSSQLLSCLISQRYQAKKVLHDVIDNTVASQLLVVPKRTLLILVVPKKTPL
jgi:hypothetical protein